MAIRDILKMGNPDLLKVSEPIDFEKDDLKTLIEDMKETMKANDGAGLAAPQIGVFKRLVIFGFDTNDPIQRQTPFPLLSSLTQSSHPCRMTKKMVGRVVCLSLASEELYQDSLILNMRAMMLMERNLKGKWKTFMLVWFNMNAIT